MTEYDRWFVQKFGHIMRSYAHATVDIALVFRWVCETPTRQAMLKRDTVRNSSV